MRKTVTVFGSSIPLPGEKEYEDGYKLGQILAKNNLNVCTGGNHGIMDAVSKGAAENGSEAIGITMNKFKVDASKYLTKQISTSSLFERINKLIDHGDAYIILNGGTGTLLELSTVWEFFNKSLINQKPVACYGGMWKIIVDEMEKRIVLEKRKTELIKCFDNLDECADYIISRLD
jgi:uncharacterized protein (TIGR00730 family)